MKLTICLFLLSVAAMAAAVPAEEEGVKLEDVLTNRRLLLPYIKCALEQGKCSVGAKTLKEHIKEALETDCAKCDDKRKAENQLVFKHLINKEKDYWNQLVAKYDPPRQYAPKFEKLYLGKE